MLARSMVATAIGACFTLAAVAQTTEYYVVQDATTKKCTIFEQKPTTSVVQVGPLAFKSRTEAEAGMKTIKVCETQ